MEEGEHWAYRKRRGALLEPALVLKVGKERAKRVKVQYLDDAREGRIEWIPAGRLKCLWDTRSEFLGLETALDELGDTDIDDALDAALDHVVSRYVDDKLATNDYRTRTLWVQDEVALAEQLGDLDPFLQLGHYRHDGDLILSTTGMIAVVRAVASLHAREILLHVEEETRRADRESTQGGPGLRNRKGEQDWIEPDISAHVHDHLTRPMLNHLLGEPAGDRSELLRQRDELVRVTRIAIAALKALRAHGQKHLADRLSRELRNGS
jgi:hypothetical protein